MRYFNIIWLDLKFNWLKPYLRITRKFLSCFGKKSPGSSKSLLSFFKLCIAYPYCFIHFHFILLQSRIISLSRILYFTHFLLKLSFDQPKFKEIWHFFYTLFHNFECFFNISYFPLNLDTLHSDFFTIEKLHSRSL